MITLVKSPIQDDAKRRIILEGIIKREAIHYSLELGLIDFYEAHRQLKELREREFERLRLLK